MCVTVWVSGRGCGDRTEIVYRCLFLDCGDTVRVLTFINLITTCIRSTIVVKL